MNNDDLIAVMTIEDATRWHDDLSIDGRGEFRRFSTRGGEFGQTFDRLENPGHQTASGAGIVQRDMVGDFI